jgi:hypothetical protein
MITTFLAPAVERVTTSKERSLWFQQDGATCHTARESMACLRQPFSGRLISRYGDLPWSPRSPDLADPDFFMGLREGKGMPNKAQDFAEIKGLYSRRNP